MNLPLKILFEVILIDINTFNHRLLQRIVDIFIIS